MLHMHPESRATCQQVVESLEAISKKTLEDEDYCIRVVQGRSRNAAADEAISPSSPLAFDPCSKQIIKEEDFAELGISGISMEEMQDSREEVSSIHVEELSADALRYMRRPYLYRAAPGTSDIQMNQEITGRSGAPGLGSRQDKSWFHRFFCGCFA